MGKSVCFFDFETYDPSLLKYGSGSVFKYHYPEVEFDIIGCGVLVNGKEEYIDFTQDYEAAKHRLMFYLLDADILVAHNAAYDLACLKYIYRDELDLSQFEVHDTMLMGKLVTQQLMSYSLEALTTHFKCVQQKEGDILHDYVWSSGVYQAAMKEATGRNRSVRPSYTVLHSWCITRLKEFPLEIVSEYCLQDVRATQSLYARLMRHTDCITPALLEMQSDITKVCLKMKFRGLRIDLSAAKQLSKDWGAIAIDAEANVRKVLNDPTLNINSVMQLGKTLEARGYPIQKTAKGNYSITAEWLEEQSDNEAAFKHLKRYRKAGKAQKDFVQKLLDYQEIIPEKYREKGIGVLYPTLKPFGATATGRFTSGGGTGSLELNVLAISGRDEEFGMPIRKLFIPNNPDDSIVCCDFSAQEIRLQVHYAKLLNCIGIDVIVDKWQQDPKMKYHQAVADMTGLDYNTAKMVTLGLSYDMHAHGLSMKLDVTMQKAQSIIDQYHKLLPFMKQLQDTCAATLKKNRYIRTIGGRKLFIDAGYEWNGKLRTQERKAMSKLIQGSAADQMIKSMIAIDKAGFDIILTVHDELLATTANPEQDLLKVRELMETAYTLKVPVVAEGAFGNSWYSAKP